MPYSFNLSKQLRNQGWKVKIYEKERLEPPHLTIRRLNRTWRVNLRTREFLVPPGGSWHEIDGDLKQLIEDETN